MTDLATHRQKKVQGYPGKICRCSNSAFLHRVEWDRLVVHRTLKGVSTQYSLPVFVAHENSTFRNLALAVSRPFMA